MKLNDCNLSQEAKLSIVRIALDQMNDGNADHALLDELNALRLADLEIFCRRLPMTIDIDVGMFKDSLERLRHARKAENMAREFVRRGASNTVLHRLFGISKAQAEHIKSQEGVAGKFIGRPKLPSQQVRMQIFAQWTTLAGETPDPRERYLLLSDMFPDVAISSLHQVVNQGERDATRVRKLEEALLA